MRKSIYGITGVLGSAALYLILSSGVPIVEDVSASPEDFKIEESKQYDTLRNTVGSTTTIFENGTYQLTEQDYDLFLSKGIVKYGKKNPMFYFRKVAPAPVEDKESPETPNSEPGQNVLEIDESLMNRSIDNLTGLPNAGGIGSGLIGLNEITEEALGSPLGFNVETGRAEEVAVYDAVKAFLSSNPTLPVDKEYYGVTSNYGEREDPFTKKKAIHTGTDFSAPGIKGTNVYSVAPGVVSYIEKSNSGYGNHVLIDHGEYKTLYGHLDSFSGLSVGDEVNSGSLIGKIGSTGRSTGPHLHFEFRIGSVALDPYLFLSNLN